MAIPGLAGAATSDKGKRFLAGFTDFMTGGRTDLDNRGDSPFQRDTKKYSEGMKKLTGGIVNPVMNYFAGGTPMSEAEARQKFPSSFLSNAMELNKMNGTQRMDTGETSQGAQELAQKVQQNEMSGLQQRTANFMQNLNPYNSLYPGSPENPMDPMGVPLVPGPDGQLINENLMKLTGGDRDELERRRQILGGM